MVAWLLVVSLLIVCVNLILCLAHKSKENHNILVITAIFFKFVSNINEQVSEKVVHNCMLNAIKSCLNDGIILIDSGSNETEVCEKVAREIYQVIIKNERKDD